jgi:hypothetical protein
MASEVSICNMALQKIGAESRITSLTEDSRNARECNTCYAEMRDAELEAHRWNFAKKRVQLTADTGSPAHGNENQFTIPTDCLRILLPHGVSVDWEYEGGKIITADSGPIDLTYIRRVTDPNQMPATFRELLSCRIAAQICEPITQSNAKLGVVAEFRKEALREARRTNAFQNIPADHDEDAWINARL